MARNNRDRALEKILGHEGGYTNDPRDPGNWTGGKRGVGVLKGTKFGIAAASYPHLDIPNLTLADAINIYAKNYWDKVRGNDLPGGVDYATADYAVNSGPSRSAKDLQRVVGAGVDGIIGPETFRQLGTMSPVAIVQKLCARRLSFMRGLAIWKTFGKGWTRRVTDVEAVGVKWALEWMAIPQGTVHKELERKADDAAKKTRNNGAAAGGSTVGAGSSGTATDPAAVDMNILPWILVAVFSVAIIFFGYKAWVHYNRKKSFEKASRET